MSRNNLLHCLQAACLLLLAAAPAASQSQQGGYEALHKRVKSTFKYSWRLYKEADKMVKTYDKCLGNGYSQAQCQQAALLCGTYNFITGSLSGQAAAFYKKYQLFQAFKPNCGDGECFQCCFTANPGYACHTSFVGFPVINCNTNLYGPATRAAGLALITGGDPGGLCAFTPQTCDHLPLCLSTLPPADIAAINNNPGHIMKSQHAREQRARQFAQEMMENQLSGFLTNFNNGDPLQTDSSVLLYDNMSLTDLFDFFSDRGHPHWQENLDSLSAFSFNQPAFAIFDTLANQFLPGPSQWNYTRQTGLASILASVPKLRERLDFTGSYIYTPSELNSYIHSAGDPDSLLQAQMHPLSYYFITENTRVQDYRLLAVPLASETPNPLVYAGDTLGLPPVLSTGKTYLDSNRVKLNLSVFFPGTHSPNYPFSGLVYWGDGVATAFEYHNYLQDTSLYHTYRSPGGYQALVYLQNSSGLRCIKFEPVQVQTNYNLQITQAPALSELWLHDASIGTTLFTFTEKIGLDITTGIDTSMVTLGTEASQVYNNYALRSLDTIIVSNPSLFPLDSIVIAPRFFNDAPAGYSVFRFTHFKGLIYDPVQEKDIVVNIPLPLSSIKLYDTYGKLRPEAGMRYQEANGLKVLYIEFDTFNIGKVVLPINADSLKNYYIPPVTSPSWASNDTLYVEVRPDYFIPHVLPECGYEWMNVTRHPIPSGTYRNNGHLLSSGTVAGGSDVKFHAAQAVTLLPGFHAQPGALFEARIQACIAAMNGNLESSGAGAALSSEAAPRPAFRPAGQVIGDSGLFLFSIPAERSEVSLVLVNGFGDRLTVLDRASYGQGDHQFMLVREGIPSGVYELEFVVDEVVEAKGRVVVR